MFLTKPYSKGEEELLFPLGLCRIAGVLSRHEVEVYDPGIIDEQYAGLAKAMKKFNPDIVGIALRNIDSPRGDILFYLDLLRSLIAIVKKTRPDVKIMVGGTGFSMFAEEIMGRIPEIDYGVFLEGEQSVPELLADLGNPRKVEGVYYRKNDSIRFTGAGRHVDPDSIPLLRWDLLRLKPYLEHPDAIGIDTKRGCTESCAYCNYPYLSGRVLRLRPPQRVVDEIESLLTSCNIKRIMFADNVFNKPIEHAEAICKEIIKRKISIEWTAWFSPKYITKEFMQLAVESGCVDFAFSPDAYSDRVLKILKKNITSEDIMNSYRLARAIKGAGVSYNFLVNPPGQNLYSFLRVLLFLLRARLGLRGKLVSFNFWHPIRIYPYTELSRIAVSEGIIDNDTDLLFPVFYSNNRAPYIDTIYRGLQLVKRILNPLR